MLQPCPATSRRARGSGFGEPSANAGIAGVASIAGAVAGSWALPNLSPRTPARSLASCFCHGALVTDRRPDAFPVQGNRKERSVLQSGLAKCALAASVSAVLHGSRRTARPWALTSFSRIVGTAACRRSASATVARASGLIGQEAPLFTAKAVVDQDFQDVSLSSYRGKYVVLFFYPLDFTFVCPTEIIAFSDRMQEFAELNAQVLGVSVDSEYAHLAWIQMSRDDGGLGDLKYPLVSDLKKDIANAYGVLAPEGVAFRGLFIIDKDGIVQHSTVNNMGFGRNVDEVIRVLQAVQYVQSNPDEVCPAGWQPGEKTMRPDSEGKKEYFKKG